MARVHIVGAGLAGLSAGCGLCESAKSSSERRRRRVGAAVYFDSTLNLTIDNGNHLLLSGNDSALAYAKKSAAPKNLPAPTRPTSISAIWRAEDAGACAQRRPLPCGFSRRSPRARHGGPRYLALVKLLFAPRDQKLRPFIGTGDWRATSGPLSFGAQYRSVRSLAFLAGAIVRETFAKGGPLADRWWRLRLERRLRRSGAGFFARMGLKSVRRELRGMEFSADRVVRS